MPDPFPPLSHAVRPWRVITGQTCSGRQLNYSHMLLGSMQNLETELQVIYGIIYDYRNILVPSCLSPCLPSYAHSCRTHAVHQAQTTPSKWATDGDSSALPHQALGPRTSWPGSPHGMQQGCTWTMGTAGTSWWSVAPLHTEWLSSCTETNSNVLVM